MVKRSVVVRLNDMLAAVDGTTEIIEGLSFEDYQQRLIVRRAVERCVEIVSEASRHLPSDLTERHPEAHWQEIRGIGNLLRHEYQRVDDLVMWRIATKYFPELKPVLVDMLNRMSTKQ